MMFRWLQRLLCVAFLTGVFVMGVAYDRATLPQPEQTSPGELYATVQRHLSACRWADFPSAYHQASNSMHERFSLGQFERKLRRDYSPVVSADHVEYGAVHHFRNNSSRALVDVYFVSRRGTVSGWTYALVFEDGDWKVDGADLIPGWPSGRRLKGLHV